MPKKLEKNHFRIFLMIGLLMLIIIAFLIYKFIFNHPVVQYTEAEIETFNQISGIVEQHKKTEDDLKERLRTEEHQIESTITSHIDFSDVGQMMKWVQGLLPTTQFELTRYYHPETHETSLTIDVLLQKINLLQFNLYQDENITAVQSPLILNKAIGLHNEELSRLFETFHKNSPLDHLPNVTQWQNESLTTGEAIGLFRNYLSILLDGIKNAEIQLTEDVVYNGETFNYYEAYMNEEAAKSLLEAILKELFEVEQINHFISLFDEEQDFFQFILNELNVMQLPNGVSYEAYFNNDYVAHRKLDSTIVLWGKEIDFSLTVDTTLTSEEEFELIANLSFAVNGGERYFVHLTVEGYSESESYFINRNFYINSGDNEETRLMTIDVQSKYSDDKTENYVTINPHLIDDLTFNAQTITERFIEQDEAIRNTDSQFEIKFNENSLEETEVYSIELSVSENIAFTGEFNHTIIEESEILFLDQLDGKEILTLVEDIREQLMDYVEQLIRRFIPFF